MIVYLTKQGSEVIKEGQHLVIKKDDYRETLFTHRIDQLVIFGNIKLSHFAMVQLLKYEIDTVFLTENGKFLGRLSFAEAKNIALRKKQFELAENQEYCLKIAKNIVMGKCLNLVTVLMRIQRTKKINSIKGKAEQIKSLFRNIENATSVDTVRGYEGRASQIYFSCFNHGFIYDTGFQKRVRRPPTDPVNSLLSLLYTFLMNRVYTAVRLAYLDPYIGVLHTLDYGRYSLVLDLMEEFRPVIVDTLVFSLFNLKILTLDSFERVQNVGIDEVKIECESNDLDKIISDPIGVMTPNTLSGGYTSLPEQKLSDYAEENHSITGKYPIKIKEECMKKVIDAFEKKLTTTFFHTTANKELTYSEAINFQAKYYRRVLEGEFTEYVPLLLR